MIESRSIEYVPLSERHGKVWHLWPIWFTGDAHLATLASGAIAVAMGLNLAWSAVAIVAGGALGTFFMAFHSAQGPQMGLPQMIQSRPQFGYRGALLVWLVALATYIGYNAFNQQLAARTIHQLTGAPIAPSMVAFTLLALVLAIIGYRLIHKAQRWLAYVMIAALTAFTIGAAFFIRLPASQFDLGLGSFKTIPFLTQFFAAAAYQLSWSIYVSDYSRYLPRDVGVRSSFWWTFVGALLGGAWMMLVGALATAWAPGVDIVAATRAASDAITPGFGTVMLVASLLGLITITSLNFYGAALTLLSVVDSFSPIKPGHTGRIISLAVIGVVATSLSLSSPHLVDRFEELLAVLLYLFTPWTAINLVDFYLVRRSHYSILEIFKPSGMYGMWNWRGLSAYALGFVAMVPFFSTAVYVGPAAKALGGADISMLIGLPVAGIAYLLACRSMDLSLDRHLATSADLQLEH
ncbi:MAG: cytosine permease [Pseudomonadota bacterium]|uniref:purine-cytosine permease family protein n=1 Tax=Phenylobacterium sp. TaxID=1871053 RepID=UPI0025FC15CD|nr:cytosine permease [Phenylobacterium sp.]